MEFAFVILHYGSAEVTQHAVDSVVSLAESSNKLHVIVVDNASPGDTGNIVFQSNKEKPNFIFLKSETNVGFARGNNIGFQYAKDVLKADFIILMNNDAVIESPNFCQLVLDDFENERFAVLGPYIHTPNGCSQNPLRKKLLKGFRLKLTQCFLLLDLLLTWLYVAPILSRLVACLHTRQVSINEIPMNNVELHGSFLIFSSLYVQKFDGLDERTFMYCEEEFLFARCVSNGIKSRYNPILKVFHNEIGNSDTSVCSLRKKSLFRKKNCLKSLKTYSEYVKSF